MKNNYLLLIFSLLIISCSSDDSNGDNNTSTGSFIPTTQGNYWVYDVQSNILSGRDSLYMSNDTIINNLVYQKLKTKQLPYGFLSNALNNNGIRQADGKIYLSGSAGLNFSQDLPFNLSVNDFVIFDENASDNTQLATISGTINQEIEGYTLTLNYNLTSTSKPSIENFISGNNQYNIVKPVEITLNLGIDVTVQLPEIPIPFTYPLMPQQNVVVSTQYYAQGIGAVKTITDLFYNLAQLPNIELPIPQSGTEHQEEILVDYSVE
ncbi:hypothetical protein [Flavobacterium sp. NRK1]|uniref:hypothetical protein n=1 Tax=Flavobacterium sp. NRK1 TaxID=2954929 RepID=UPI00209211BF|nr:hypothetical protein [Flavobacterium sp. NRK1]MCO6149361.1 hypothetical protein [Flavobacterium sp. NRK1]